MTLPDFLTTADSLVGQSVRVEGWLTSDTVNVWLADHPHSQQELVVVQAPHVVEWLLRHIPPRIGGVCAYSFEAEVSGLVQPRSSEGVPVLGGEVRAVLQFAGRLHL
jgi:hypothetical protein